MSQPPVLIDVSCLCPAHTDLALDVIAKAQGEDPPGDALWDEHENPYIRDLIELFTKRGLARLSGMSGELQKWLRGQMHAGARGARPERPPGAMVRWSPAELDLVKLYLAALPPSAFTLDDWMMLVDYLVQRYLPADDLRTEADWLATRASMLGRLQASTAMVMTGAEISALISALPLSTDAAEHAFGLAVGQRAAMEYGAARCAENVIGMADGIRHRLRRAIMDYSEAQFTGDAAGAYGSLQTKLMDEFGTMNRDWRRIAVTEAGENMNQGLVASMPVGTRMRRVEKYRGACAFCRSIDGKIVKVVDAKAPKKEGTKEIWAGKTNVGRSVAPRRRLGNKLVEREPHEMFWIAAGTQHPNCRGVWVPIAESKRPVDPEFSAWMDDVLGRAAR